MASKDLVNSIWKCNKLMLTDSAPAGRDVYSPTVTLLGSRSVGAQQQLAHWPAGNTFRYSQS